MALLEYDSLTQAYRREGLTPTLAHLVRDAVSTGTPLALAVLDLDHFKALNDVYGHAVGDAVLRAVVARIMNALRDEDLVFRYGGDEFVVLLPTTPRAEAASVLQRVAERVTSSPIDAGPHLWVQVSVGLASVDEGSEKGDAEALFARADARLYQAKRAGRNLVVTDDEPDTDVAGGLAEVRLVGRDAVLADVDSFLTQDATSAAGRVLHLSGPAGSGFTRLLHEVAVRARQAGRTVRDVRAAPVNAGVHLRALQSAYPGEVAPDTTEAQMARELAQDAAGPGLVVLLEGGANLDPASRALLAAQLDDPNVHVIEAVPDGAEAAFLAARTRALPPLTPNEVGGWLSAALGSRLEQTVVRTLARAAGGRPAPIARAVRALQADGGLAPGPQGHQADPARVERDVRELERPAPQGRVQLPSWEGSLVGRSAWLDRVTARVADARVVTLVGPGGVGKSRLAAQLARELADGVPGGTDWVDLRAARRSDDLAHALADATGVRPSDDLAELAERWGDARRRLVLDEADALADQAGVLQALSQHAPSLRLLVTARMPLRIPEEQVVEVPELSRKAATELFRRGMARAGAREGADDEALRPVLARIGTTPLSVELASTWTRTVAPAELARTLDARPEALTFAPGGRSRTDRTIDVTRELMSAGEREALGTLSLIPAGFEAAQARAAADASPFFLLALLERSLLRREGARYTVHAAIRERFAGGLVDPGRARDRVALAYAEVARGLNEMEIGERTARGFAVADAERANLVMAWHALLNPPRPEAAWPLATLLRGYFDVRGRSKEGLALFTAGDDALQGSSDRTLRGWVRECTALFLAQRGRLDEAEVRIAEALALLDDGAPDGALAMAWNTSGLVRGLSGRLDEAVQAFERAAELRRASGDAVGEAQARGNVALALTRLERPAEARTALEAAIVRYREVNHVSGLALSLAHLASLVRRGALGEPGEAAAFAHEAFTLAESVGYAHGARLGAFEWGQAEMARGRPSEAATAFGRAHAWAQEEDDPAVLREVEGALQEAQGAVGEPRDPC